MANNVDNNSVTMAVNGDIKDPKLYINTPLIESLPMSKLAGCTVYLKLENTQPSASFKLRGISNLIKKVLSTFVGANIQRYFFNI